MCTASQLKNITRQINREAQIILKNKFKKALLYGSYARGDNNNDSDIDIMILADIPADETWKARVKFDDIINKLDLEHDVLISLIVKDNETFYKWLDVMPFYQNVLKDGVELSA